MDSNSADADPCAQLARIIYEQMNTGPRRMHVAITLAKEHLDAIRRALVDEGLRSP